jgi:hypothetical protein
MRRSHRFADKTPMASINPETITPLRASNSEAIAHDGSDTRGAGTFPGAPRFGNKLARILRRFADAIEMPMYEHASPAPVAVEVIEPIDMVAPVDEERAERIAERLQLTARLGAISPYDGVLMGPPDQGIDR